MSPSGGEVAWVKRSVLWSVAMHLMLVTLWVPKYTEAMVARQTYYMDQRMDCLAAGFQSIPRDQITSVYGRSDGNTGTQINCYIQFEPETSGDTLKVAMQSGSYINSPNVEIYVEVKGAGSYTYTSMSGSQPGPLEAVDGKATLRIKRRLIQDTDFYFVLTVTAKDSTVKEPPGSSSTADVGMIVGIVAGVIVAIIIIAIIAMCCIRKRKWNSRDRGAKELKQDLTKESLNTSVGYDNSPAKIVKATTESESESPRSDRKLLGQNKPRSALERFGQASGPRRKTLDSKGSDYDDVERGRQRGVYEEREVRPRVEDRFANRGPRADVDGQRDYENRDYVQRENEYGDRRQDDYYRDDRRQDPYNERDVGRRRGDYEEQEMRRPDEDPRRSPLLSDLRHNPRFRRSFHEANHAPETRTNQSADESTSSSVSVDSNGVPLPPKLPPVPKSPPRSPSPQRRGEKIATIFRARPSSSVEVVRVGEENEVEDSGGDADRKPGTHVSRRDREDKKEIKHSLRPNRAERKTDRNERKRSNSDEEEETDSGEERRRRRREKEREKERREEERARRKKQEEEEEEEEERRRKKEHERKKKKEEEKRREEEEEEEERSKRKDDEKHGGRFKKSTSGRRSKGKAPRMGRSRSTGNALEELEDNYQRSRSKSPSSVRSLNFIEDDDEDVDSNYMPFRRAGSKTSLYTSRTSLTGRRRKNSMGETMSLSSYARTDDMDSRYGDFRGSNMSHRDKERLFRSTGDLEMRPASAQIVRDCATQTGADRGVYVYGKKTMAKGRVGKRYSRGTQTFGRERRDSDASAISGKSSRLNRMKSRSKSQESLSKHRGRSKSRDRDYSDDDDGHRRKKHRSKSRGLDDDDDDTHSKSSRSKPRARPRKSTGTASVDLTDSEDDFDDDRSGVTSSVAPSSVYAPTFQPPFQPGYPQMIPVAYPAPPGMAFVPTAPGGPPMVLGAPPHGASEKHRPPIAPKPKQSKWDQLISLTDGEKQRRRQYGGDIAETESVLSSSYGAAIPPSAQVMYAPPSYTTAQRLPDPNSTFSTSYPNSSGEGRTPRDYKFSGSVYTDSVI